jgi:hypothetical protein
MKTYMYLVLIAFLLVPALGISAEYSTIGKLVAAYDDRKCRECHAQIYAEWKATPHADSVNLSLGGLRNFAVLGVDEWWGRKLTKAEIMKCMDCHAPVVKFATPELAVKIANMIVTAKETKDKKEKAALTAELGRLNVGCVACHNLKATTVAIGRLGEPIKGAVYGTRGNGSTAHRTIKSAEIKTSVFCMQCHGNYTAPDGEVIKCNTLNGSYQDAYLARGGSRTCQDCHIKAKDRGHRMLGGRDLELVKEGIGFTAEISRYLHLPGKGEKLWTPSAIVAVSLENRAGHRIPDG